MDNIRPLKETEIDQIIEIWITGSIKAHNFIDKEYWESKKMDMKTMYIPMSKTFIIQENEKIVAFISMIDHYLAALFVHIDYQKKGYGKSLLQYIKLHKDIVKLKVYQKNKNAVKFYLNNGFVIKEELFDEHTSEKELLMSWQKSK
ncbi:N-acetyltransferase [Bacillus aquiflavi]|uniref:N-acetyltransferase n=1 Tax=Bacillus aquiflavi TaxID=2672567 RepID=UPI00223AC184|nr:N-acetyltransferase [Bacillus aquiflavi]